LSTIQSQSRGTCANEAGRSSSLGETGYTASTNGQRSASSRGAFAGSSTPIRRDGSAAWYPSAYRSSSTTWPTGENSM
jgi:hypothetical protein